MTATFIYMMFILKIPILMLFAIVWWAWKSEPAEEEAGGSGGSKRPRPPLHPRGRGPHGRPRPAAPPRVRATSSRAPVATADCDPMPATGHDTGR